MILERDDSLVGDLDELDCELIAGNSSPFVVRREFDIVYWKGGGPEKFLERVVCYGVFRNAAVLVAGEEEVVLKCL